SPRRPDLRHLSHDGRVTTLASWQADFDVVDQSSGAKPGCRQNDQLLVAALSGVERECMADVNIVGTQAGLLQAGTCLTFYGGEVLALKQLITCLLQALVQNRGDLALFRVEIAIAGAQCQAIGFSLRGDANQ